MDVDADALHGFGQLIAHRLRQQPAQGPRSRIDHRHPMTGTGQIVGEFTAHQPGPDQQDTAGLDQRRAPAAKIVQIVDGPDLARQSCRTGIGTHGQDQGPVGDHRPGFQMDLPGLWIDSADLLMGQNGDLQIGFHLLGGFLHQGRIGLLLGQGVGQHGFAVGLAPVTADHRDGSGLILAAELAGQTIARQPRSNDHHTGGWCAAHDAAKGSKSDLETPQSGQHQSSGISAKAVPAGMPSSGMPMAGL